MLLGMRTPIRPVVTPHGTGKPASNLTAGANLNVPAAKKTLTTPPSRSLSKPPSKPQKTRK